MKKVRRKRKRRKHKHRRRVQEDRRKRARRKIAQASERAIVAPKNFSFIENPEEILVFFDEIKRICANGDNIFIDLSDIENVTPETLVVFLSKIRDRRFTKNMPYGGNLPEDPELVNIIEESGFFEHVRRRDKSKAETVPIGQIFERKSYKVEADRSYSLLQATNKVIPGDEYFHWDGIQSAIVECMNNTRDHAAHVSDDHERWWLSVYCDRKKKEAYFTFVDNGIGIFESLKRQGLARKIKNKLQYWRKPRMLKALLEGEVQSSTGLDYRGRGLPNIVNIMNRKQLHDLIIISNNVYANVAENEYRSMSESLRGTFLHWTHRTEESNGDS